MGNKAVLTFIEGQRRFEGTSFGAASAVSGITAVFNGSVGMQEFITDPASAGLIAVMTNPITGNCGINLEDMESDEVWISGLVTREKCQNPGGWRCELELDAFLRRQGIPGLEAVDTRALTRYVRQNGASAATVINCGIKDIRTESKVYKLKKYALPGNGPNIAVIDLGIRKSVLKRLREPDIDGNLFIFPEDSEFEEVVAVSPALVLVSNGSDLKLLKTKHAEETKRSKIVELISELIKIMPVYGMGIGAVLLGIALGSEDEPLYTGHHGSSITVKSKDSKLYVTEQNHRYTIKNLPSFVKTEFININDNSIEGFSAKNAYGIMFQPDTVMTHSRSTAFFYEMLSTRY